MLACEPVTTVNIAVCGAPGSPPLLSKLAHTLGNDCGPTLGRSDGTGTLYNVGDFFFPTAHSFDEAYVTADRQRLLQRLAFHGLKETGGAAKAREVRG